MSEPKIIIDKSRFPLVMHTMCAGYGREDLEYMFREYDLLLSGKQRYALVIHFPLSVQMLMAADRKLIADWWIPRRERVAAMNIMYSIVLESPLLRGGLTALLWVIQPGNPHKMAATVEDGVGLAVDALIQNGVAMAPGLKALARTSRRPPSQRNSQF